jgi:hypothetical protein
LILQEELCNLVTYAANLFVCFATIYHNFDEKKIAFSFIQAKHDLKNTSFDTKHFTSRDLSSVGMTGESGAQSTIECF